MNTVEILMRAKVKIVCGWTQGMLAEDEDGSDCVPTDPAAVCWCSMGAIESAVGRERSSAGWPYEQRQEYQAAIDALKRIILRDFKETEIPVWNDDEHRTKDEVLNAFDKAIALAKEEAA